MKPDTPEYLLQTVEIERGSNVFYFEITWVIKAIHGHCRISPYA